jgi:hypothetical protein
MIKGVSLTARVGKGEGGDDGGVEKSKRHLQGLYKCSGWLLWELDFVVGRIGQVRAG